ncbi:MAG: insulinase family protein [Planctomycetaceae bacterium]|jgi:zinc protease|nr:insulinase family protein [Planctomycetaceae bacterium]
MTHTSTTRHSMPHIAATHLFAALALGASAAVAAAQDLPKRPEQIAYKPLSFAAPKASDYRHVLSNGTVVFLAPSNELPLVELEMTFKGGEYLEPADKVGLAGMTAAMLRTGGTESLSPSELDERLDFLATEASIGADATTCSASLDCLSSKFDESLSLLMDMLRRPRFDAAKQVIALDAAIEGMKQRNDDADPILSREWAMHMYGADHFEAQQPTEASMRGITKDDMAAFARQVFNPANVVVAVSGDFEPKAMLAKLEAAFADWPKGGRMPDPPSPPATFEAGVFRVEKEIPQGKVFIGTRSMMRDDPDYFAALVMNEILGGGGFTSRIMKTVRSDEGLAYSAGSGLRAGVYYPGVFRAAFQSKNPTVALAIKLIHREFDRMRNEPVSDEELAVAKQSFIETFPRSFESKPAMLGIFVEDEWTGRGEEYWQTYRDNIAKVTKEDVQRVAQRLLDPAKMAIFVVGDWDTIAPGDSTGRARMADFFDDRSTEIPLRDPLTMQPMK